MVQPPRPNSYGLAEANPCHNPVGPRGGQFCSKGGVPGVREFEGTRFRGDQRTAALKVNGRIPDPPAEFFATMGMAAGPREAVLKLRADLMAASFGAAGGSTAPVETLAAISLATGWRLDGLSTGDVSGVRTNDEVSSMIRVSTEDVLTMHTHPSSSPFSYQDIRHLTKSPDRLVTTMVAAADGSVFGLTVNPKVKGDYWHTDLILRRFAAANDAVMARARDLTTAYIRKKTGSSSTDVKSLRVEALAAGINVDRVFVGFKQPLMDAAYKRAAKFVEKKLGAGTLTYTSWFPPEAVAWQDHVRAEIGRR